MQNLVAVDPRDGCWAARTCEVFRPPLAPLPPPAITSTPSTTAWLGRCGMLGAMCWDRKGSNPQDDNVTEDKRVRVHTYLERQPKLGLIAALCVIPGGRKAGVPVREDPQGSSSSSGGNGNEHYTSSWRCEVAAAAAGGREMQRQVPTEPVLECT